MTNLLVNIRNCKCLCAPRSEAEPLLSGARQPVPLAPGGAPGYRLQPSDPEDGQLGTVIG